MSSVGIEGPGVIGGGGGAGPSTPSSIVLSGPESFAGPAIISPAALAAGTTNDWSPAGLITARVIRVSTNAAGSTLGGIATLLAGQVLTLENIGGAGDLTLLNAGAGSAAANRFIGIGGTDYTIPLGDSITVFHDETSGAWRQLK